MATPADGEEVSGDIPMTHLAIAFGIIAVQSAAANVLEFGNADQLLVAGIRAFIQLTCLGGILYPIFTTNHPCLVLGYIFGFMILISAYEAAARPKQVYPGIFWNAVCSLGVAVFIMGLVMLIVVRPTPWYNAQYLIPLAGMLINNALSGTALSLNQMLDHLVSQKEHVEVLLAFGATPWEAAWPGITKSVQAALIPAINGMNVLGLVSIPGMMTGQILGGATPMKAAKYQIVVTFLISGATFIAVVLTAALTTRSFFDGRGRHDSSHVTPQTRVNVSKIFDRWLKPAKVVAPKGSSPTASQAGAGRTGAGAPLLANESGAALARLSLRLDQHPERPAAGERAKLLDLDLQGLVAGSRPLDMRCGLKAGEVMCVMGPSGIGKSTLLKWICDLKPATRTDMKLRGAASSELTPQGWRRDVLYVHQSKAPLPGKPSDLLRDIQRLTVNRGRPAFDPVPHMEALGLSADFLERAWNELSGGEAQRAMCAIALSTLPAVLLFDEPTSALDDASKVLFEQRLRALEGVGVLMVTHDEQQARRIATNVWRVVEQ